MSVLPKSFHDMGGKVSCIDWKNFAEKYGSVSFFNNTIVDTFSERQRKLIEKGDIYLCLPGGVGTLSEIFDVLVENDIYHKNKKILLFSYQNFFHELQFFLKQKIEMGFIKKRHLENIKLFYSSNDIIEYLNHL